MLELAGAPMPRVEEAAAIRDILGPDLYTDLAATHPETYVLHIGRTALMHWCGNSDAGMRQWDALAAWQRDRDASPPLDESAPGFMGPDDPGGGPIIDRDAMLRAWFNAPTAAPTAATQDLHLTWRDIFTCWDDVDLDMHEQFGVDLRSGVLDDRPWPWLEARIRDLAMTPGTRLNRAILAPLYRKDTTSP